MRRTATFVTLLNKQFSPHNRSHTTPRGKQSIYNILLPEGSHAQYGTSTLKE